MHSVAIKMAIKMAIKINNLISQGIEDDIRNFFSPSHKVRVEN